MSSGPHSWTEERTTELKRLFELGLSCSQIAADLGHVTRCGVSGKLHRLGLRRENSRSAQSFRAGDPPRAPRPRIRRRRPQPHIKPMLPPPDEMESTIPTNVFPARISLLETTEIHCRWPAADDGSATMVCGDPKFGPYSWCARHCRVGLMPREQRRPAAAPSLVPEVA